MVVKKKPESKPVGLLAIYSARFFLFSIPTFLISEFSTLPLLLCFSVTDGKTPRFEIDILAASKKQGTNVSETSALDVFILLNFLHNSQDDCTLNTYSSTVLHRHHMFSSTYSYTNFLTHFRDFVACEYYFLSRISLSTSAPC